MIEIDLDHPVWLEPGGFGVSSDSVDNHGSKCSIGKFYTCANLKPDSYKSLVDIIGLDKVREVYQTNDRFELQEGHWKAVRIMLEALAASGKVTFKGSKVNDIIKEKVCG